MNEVYNNRMNYTIYTDTVYRERHIFVEINFMKYSTKKKKI